MKNAVALRSLLGAVLLGLLLLPLQALAGDAVFLYVNGETESASGGGTIRVAMRSGPSTSANVICRVYNGVEVEQLAPASGGFIKIRLGAVEGYMMSKYLAKTAEQVRLPNPAYAAVTPFGVEPTVAVFEDAGLTKVRDTYDAPLSAEVLAIAGQWAYIQPLTSGQWERVGQHGYVPADYVSETQNFRYGWVTPVTKGGTLKLYASPQNDARLLGEYFEGACLSHMYWESTDTDWVKVRFGSTVGYVKKGNHDGGFPAEIPELKAMRVTAPFGQLRLRPDESSETLMQLTQGEQVYAIGRIGDWYHVQTDTFFNSPVSGYLPSHELSQ